LAVDVVQADVTRWEPPGASLVVADPSRTGLGRKGAEVVAASGAQRLVLISCDAISLGRDSALLSKKGYRLTAMTLVDMFPQTSHVEVVSTFAL
jgi:23S rRNA (uracil1939-C5)-methyltransferase